MRLLIWGAGAIGGTIGAHLARAGHDVTFVDRAADHVQAMNANGLRITGPMAEYTIQAQAFMPDGLSGEWDTVVLAVKAQDTADATRALAPHLADSGYVVSAQNGLNELVIQRIVGQARTIGCFVNFGADYIQPGVIMFGGRGAVVLGELDGHITPRLRELHHVFQDFEPNAVMTSNIWGYLWGKLAYGAQLFATALTNESIVDCFSDPAYHEVYIALGQEVMRVAQARGVQPEAFNGFDPHAFLPGVDRSVSEQSLRDMVEFNRRSAKTHSGIWRDLAIRKRRTEVDAQLGPIVTLGAEVGVPTPLTARLIELIHDIEAGRRSQSLTTLDELKRELGTEA
ncbi:MAG: 2-dehydropantoate 2-reductase [Anaerolineae bacterium]|nr:2-dehydropantoate 2-reductase [Anaerolineae bacterium]